MLGAQAKKPCIVMMQGLVRSVWSTEIGRRDWTRTNDPHHVKVVL